MAVAVAAAATVVVPVAAVSALNAHGRISPPAGYVDVPNGNSGPYFNKKKKRGE